MELLLRDSTPGAFGVCQATVPFVERGQTAEVLAQGSGHGRPSLGQADGVQEVPFCFFEPTLGGGDLRSDSCQVSETLWRTVRLVHDLLQQCREPVRLVESTDPEGLVHVLVGGDGCRIGCAYCALLRYDPRDDVECLIPVALRCRHPGQDLTLTGGAQVEATVHPLVDHYGAIQEVASFFVRTLGREDASEAVEGVRQSEMVGTMPKLELRERRPVQCFGPVRLTELLEDVVGKEEACPRPCRMTRSELTPADFERFFVVRHRERRDRPS